jgi:hypothetical protein
MVSFQVRLFDKTSNDYLVKLGMNMGFIGSTVFPRRATIKEIITSTINTAIAIPKMILLLKVGFFPIVSLIPP